MKIIIVGEGGSGKDYFANTLTKTKYYKKAVLDTTRSKRINEIDGIDYNFIKDDDIDKNKYICISTFNNWFYGLRESEFNNSQVIVLSPILLEQIRQKTNENLCVIWVTADKDVRMQRLMSRNDLDSVERRLKADYLDFENFTDYDIKLKS